MVVAVVLVALILPSLGSPSNSHVRAWSVGVTAGGTTLIAVRRTLLPTVSALVIASMACYVGKAIFGVGKSGRSLPSFLGEKRRRGRGKKFVWLLCVLQ